ncbi:MAG: Gfo/Idh/MocA family oxidoreductase [Deferrisomatales bacterium]|nr:Gfo/Idh/MocA family oxidoreductase [Deferrisomatales bacterium]
MVRIAGPLRLGIIGCGKVAEERHLPALQRLPQINVVAAADVDADRVEMLSQRFGVEHRFTDYRALVDRQDIDAVGVLTPTQSHAEIGLAALAAQKHVLIEKPLALNLDECDQLLARAAGSPVKVVVGFNLRWHRLVSRARELVQSGVLGPIKAIHSVYTHDRIGADAPDWHRKLSLGGGVLFNEAVHHFDLWQYLLGTEVEQVFSFSRPSGQYEDAIHVTTATLANGALATGLFSFRTSPTSQLEIYGEAGRLHLDCYRFDGLALYPRTTYPGDLRDRAKKAVLAVQGLPDAVPALRQGGDFQATFCGLWRHFAGCIAQDGPSECTLEDGRRALRTALASLAAASSGRPVRL